MTAGFQSIEDLISSDNTSHDDDSVQAKFSQKTKEINIKNLEQATEKKAAGFGVPYINLVGFPISPEALGLIKEEEAHILKAACFYFDGKNIRMATTDSNKLEVKNKLKELEEQYFSKGELYLISEHSLEYAYEMYRTVPKIRENVRGVRLSEEDLNKYSEKFTSFKDLQAEINQAGVTEIVTMIMAASIKTNTSDIHIEADEQEIKIRFRVDGVLLDAAIINKSLWKKIISRLKILAKVKLNIADKPQDGHISIIMSNEKVDIRASFLPTNYGESVVMRLLRSSSVGLKFEELGIEGEAFKSLKREVERPNGMIITTGPTGSGKTTSLYGILKKLNKPEVKIITIEDPIEYQLRGINQSQTSDKYTFAQGLRSIVRQDPDVIMVGEIRDLETAEIAIQAALTGHLVLSTIHTNDAAGTIPRFLSMGVKPFLLAPALNTMIGQRLVRVVCSKCKKEDNPDEEKLARVKELLKSLPENEKMKIDFNNLKFYKGAGCEECQDIGYKGRIGIYEVMTMNTEIEKQVLSGKVSEYEIRDIAKKNGMITMAQDGLLKALKGITSLDEVFRVAE